MTRRAQRHFDAARAALERGDAADLMTQVVGILHEVMQPSKDDSGVESQNVVDAR